MSLICDTFLFINDEDSERHKEDDKVKDCVKW